MAKSNEMKVLPYLKKWKWLAKFLDMEDWLQMMLDKEKEEKEQAKKENSQARGGGWAVDIKDDDPKKSRISYFDRDGFFEADSPQEEEVKAVVRRNSIQVKHEISNLIRARAKIIERLAKEKEVLQTEQDRKVETDARLVMVQGQLESAVKKRDAVLARYHADARKAMGLDDSNSDEE